MRIFRLKGVVAGLCTFCFPSPAGLGRGNPLRPRAAVGGRATGIPAGERASDASLRQRVAMLAAENRRLREENHALKAELALAYGARREARGGAT